MGVELAARGSGTEAGGYTVSLPSLTAAAVPIHLSPWEFGNPLEDPTGSSRLPECDRGTLEGVYERQFGQQEA